MIYKFFKGFMCFALMLLFGILSFNLSNLDEKLQMLQVINEFHRGQLNYNKKVIDNLLTDNFTESGVNDSVQESKIAYKSDVMSFDYSKTNAKSIEVHFWSVLNILSNSNNSLSFIRTVTFLPRNGKILPSFSYFVTYTFEENVDGLKISKIERKW